MGVGGPPFGAGRLGPGLGAWDPPPYVFGTSCVGPAVWEPPFGSMGPTIWFGPYRLHHCLEPCTPGTTCLGPWVVVSFGTTVWDHGCLGPTIWDHACLEWVFGTTVWDYTVWDHRLGPCLGPWVFGTHRFVWDHRVWDHECLGPTIWDHACLGPWFGTIVWDLRVWDLPFGAGRFGTMGVRDQLIGFVSFGTTDGTGCLGP